MLIELSPTLDSLTVCAEQAEQETILGAAQGKAEPLPVWTCENPVLLTDTARIAELSPGLRDAVLALYESYPRTVSYNGTSVSWSPTAYPRVWCPSIDTVFLARALDGRLNGLQTFAEIGCGSGFLTKYALQHAPDIRRAVASDISLAALRCASDALEDVSHRASVSFVCPQPDGDFNLSGRFQTVVCNPPYIPRPGERMDNPYEGLTLIHKLAADGKQLLADGGELLLNISSLSGDKPARWFADHGWTMTHLDSMRVPLKVNAVTSGVTPESRAWYEYLVRSGAIVGDGEQGYRLWHELNVFSCRPG